MQLAISSQVSELRTGDPNPANLPIHYGDNTGGGHFENQRWIGDFPPRQDEIYHPNDIIPYIYPTPSRTFTSSTINFGHSCQWRVKKHKKSIVLSIDVPGIKVEDMSLELDEGKLTVTAKRFDTKERVSHTYEIGHIYNSMTAKATLESGVLTVKMSKHREHASQKIAIEEK